MRLSTYLRSRRTGLLRSKHPFAGVRMMCVLAGIGTALMTGVRCGAQSLSAGVSRQAATMAALGSGFQVAGRQVAGFRESGVGVRGVGAGSAKAGTATPLNASWQAVGPNQIASAAYGLVTGRVTAVAIDPADATGNTVYLGTTGGGVWKSTNAAGAPGAVRFTPLTDTLPVFNANAGATAIPSLSIGALRVQNGVILAGTGDPNDALDSYYGSGLLRSEDGGLTWTLIQQSQDGVGGRHTFSGLGVAGFAGNGDSSVLVMAMADSLEGDLVNAVDQTNSVRGLYFSIDSGVTWQMSVVMDGSQTVQTPLPTGGNAGGNAATAVVWNPVRKSFYAAVRYHGYYESADGATWHRLAQQPGATLPLAACPTNPGTTGNPSCPIFRGALAVEPVTGDLFALTVDSSNRDQGLWQDACGGSGSSAACASPVVTFGRRLASAALEAGGGSTVIPQADYNLVLAAAATGVGTGSPDTVLYVGTADLFRCSLAAGCRLSTDLRNTTNARNGCAAPAGVAGAQHAIAVQAGAAGMPLVYLGNDGGLWRSLDGVNEQAAPCSPDDANHFQNLNGGLGSLGEVISLAEDPVDPNVLLARFGANGSAGTGAAGAPAPGMLSAWPQLGAGEGGTVAIDPLNPLNWYLSTAAGVSIRQCGSGAGCTAADFAGTPTIGLPQVSRDASVIDPPWLLDPALASNVVIGTCRVWRGPAANGTAWSPGNAISTMLGGPQSGACTGTNPVLRALAAGGPAHGVANGAATGTAGAQDAGSTVLYAGMAGPFDGGGSVAGHVFSTTAGGTAGSGTVWTDITGSHGTNGNQGFNPGGFDVSSLIVDAHDPTGSTVYATVMGFADGRVYRSSDAGAHWVDLSSNLPTAPANSVVVDPNDANTVYVALDTGVYVTQQVTTCTSANCWSRYGGASLPNAPVMVLAAAGGMATGDGRTGELRAGTYGRGIWGIPLLTAVSGAAPAMSLSPASLTFGAQAVATASAAQTITVTNTGIAPLTVSSIAVSGAVSGTPSGTEDFTETDSCVGTTVVAGGSCAVQIAFLPQATGAWSGLLTVYGNVAGGQATAALAGTGTPAAAIVLNPIAVRYPATTVGASSLAENVTISNTSSGPATVQSATVTGDFRISANTCGATLGPSTGCTVAIVFSPTGSGTRSGALTVADSAGTQTASLTGVGTAPATDALSPLSLAFLPQQIGTGSGVQLVTLSNSGDVALTLIAAEITSGDFSVVNGCGNSLNAHAACSLAVGYVPTNVGNETGVLSVSDQYRTQLIALSGFGLAPVGVSLAPNRTLQFAALGVGIASAAQTVTLTNNSGVPLTTSEFAVTGDFEIVPGSNTCAHTVPASTACTLQVAFRPTTTGVRAGLLTVVDDAGNSPQTRRLTGIGVDFSLTAGNSTVTVASGHPGIFSLLLTSASGVPGVAVFTCRGAPVNATCLVIPAAVPLGNGTATVVVTVATGVTMASDHPLPGSVGRRSQSVWIAFGLPLGLFGWRRRRLVWLGVVCGLLMAIGCGTGRLIPGSGTTTSSPGTTAPTPPGSSTIVVSAVSAGLVRTVNLTLVVQ